MPGTPPLSRESSTILSLHVAMAQKWFQLAGQPRVDLRARGSLWRLFRALAERRLSAPDTGIPVHELFSIGWPGQSPSAESAAKRVYTAVWTLRRSGLGDLLISRDDGYLLDASVPLTRV